jgi:hypothetical protein
MIKKKKSLDDYGKKYWSEYLKETGLGEQLLKSAMMDIAEVMDMEDELSPSDLKEAYKILSEKYKNNGGFDFVRKVRKGLINLAKEKMK